MIVPHTMICEICGKEYFVGCLITDTEKLCKDCGGDDDLDNKPPKEDEIIDIREYIKSVFNL